MQQGIVTRTPAMDAIFIAVILLSFGSTAGLVWACARLGEPE